MALSTILGPIGLAVTAFSLLAIGLYDVFVSGSQAEGMLGRIEAANAAAGEAAGRVLGPIKSLIAEFGNENTTLLRKQQILNELMRSQPDYFNNLSTEATTVDDLSLAYGRLSSAIQQTSKMRALQSQLTRIAQEQATAIGEQVKAQIELEDIEKRRAAGEEGFADERVFTPNKSGVGGFFTTFDPTADRRRELNKVISDQQAIFDDLQRQAERLQEMMAAEGGEAGLPKMGKSDTGGGLSGEISAEVSDLEKIMNRLYTTLNAIDKEAEMFGTDGLKIGEARLGAYTAAFKSLVDLSFEGQDVKDNLEMVKKEIQELVGTVGEGQKLEEVNDALDKYFDRNDSLLNQYQAGLLTAEEARNQQMNVLASTLPTLIDLMGEEDAMVQALISSYLALKKAKDESNEATDDTIAVEKAQMQLTRQLNDVVMNFGASLGQAATDSKSFGQGVLQAIKDAVLATLELAYARIITNALDPKNPANQASFGLAGLGAAALGMGLLTGMIRGIEIPSFSKGGIVQGTQLAMVGDNRSGREAIIPLEKLPSLMQKMGGYGGTRVYGHLSGYDIALSSERSGKRFQRISY
jgi:hypothetical protein